jgi:hypothetical protein
MVTIATDDHHELQEFRASVGAQWPFLSDPGRRVQKDLDIQEYTDPEHDPMIPHTLVLKPGLVIHSIYNGSRLEFGQKRTQAPRTPLHPHPTRPLNRSRTRRAPRTPLHPTRPEPREAHCDGRGSP